MGIFPYQKYLKHNWAKVSAEEHKAKEKERVAEQIKILEGKCLKLKENIRKELRGLVSSVITRS